MSLTNGELATLGIFVMLILPTIIHSHNYFWDLFTSFPPFILLAVSLIILYNNIKTKIRSLKDKIFLIICIINIFFIIFYKEFFIYLQK